jgi:carbon-monoxide dehydrogenase medium subunit
MIPTSFKYKRAGSIQEALTMMDEDSKILAGGHSLIPAMKLRLNQPEKLIDISKISAIKFIRQDGDNIVIGAGSTHYDIAHSDIVKNGNPMLSQGADMIGDRQVRNAGTLGGSLAHADPAADWPAMMIASNAIIKTQTARGTREIRAADFFTGFYETALHEQEIITEIHIPKLKANERSIYLKFPQPASRFAIVGCAVIASVSEGAISDARIAFNGVSEYAFRDTAVEQALERVLASEENITEAANRAAENMTILSDPFASEKYRKHLAKVYLKRALKEISK